jgi:arginase family enzyme
VIKIFGNAFDPLDVVERVDIKLAYLNWLRTHEIPEDNFQDPYDFLGNSFAERFAVTDKVEWTGKFPVDSWLRPKPCISDMGYISPKRYTEFLDNNGCYQYCDRLIDYLSENIGASIPVMIGVDHCMTGGVLRYLKKRYADYNLLVFDSHCDMIDLETRKNYFEAFFGNLKEPYFGKDIYECGSFLCNVLNKKIVKPENLWVVGTQDLDQFKQNAESLYLRKILPWIKQGVHIISKEDLILHGIPSQIEGKTYISFDMDLGSLSSVFATRFLNYVGLDVGQFLSLVYELSEKIRTRKIELIGLDIMEIDIHFLGLNIDGNKDHTAQIADEIISSIIYKNFVC